MIEVDGNAGGGQLLRTSLTLSMVTGRAIRVENVRGDRSTPGLKPQHLTAVETAAAVADATVEGAELESETVTFEPGTPTGGTYEADVGTAGSVALVFDTLLPLAVTLDEPLTVTACGGTDVTWSPPLDYYRRVKLPQLRSAGLAAAVEPERRGFYPAGGGEATLHLWPSSPSRVELPGNGRLTGARIYSTASADLAEREVAERQASAAVERLETAGVEPETQHVTYAETECSGSALVVRIDRAGSSAGFDAFGAPGKPAEEVAGEALDGLCDFARSGAAVDDHLADQLLVFLALLGGEVRIPRLTDHVETSLDLLETFGFDLATRADGDTVLVSTTDPR